MGREYIRINFTTETDESDLIGHHILSKTTQYNIEMPENVYNEYINSIKNL